jgi:hypothetical protein
MAILEIKDRTDRLFGRDTDLRVLRDRANRTGLTAIVGPPQIGKSWLLMELARRLVESDARFCVGFTRSPRGAPDPLLQVVSDLYQRWLADARAWRQLDAAWKQQKDRLLPNFARFVGKLSEKAGKLVPGVGELFGLFNTLNHAQAEDDLSRRDALLAELRALAIAYPDDATLLESLTTSQRTKFSINRVYEWTGQSSSRT